MKARYHIVVLKSIAIGMGLLLCLSVLNSCKSKDQKEEEKPSIFDKLSHPGIVELEIVTDFDSLRLNKEEEKYQPALLTYRDSIGNINQAEIKVSARGNTRKDICSITPVRLKFPKTLLKASSLARYKTLKVVAPCKDSIQYEDYLIREHLCYRMLNLLTDYSFRVQLARVRFISSGKTKEIVERYSFLIEHQKEMAERLNGKLLDDESGDLDFINKTQYNLLCLFQYMIGNTDWNLDLRHNIKILDPGNGKSPIPIPYDFDYSGFVNAKYAQPHPSIPIDSVRQRLFQWRGKDKASLQESIKTILEQKENLLGLLDECLLINKDSKDDAENFLMDFFAQIEGADSFLIMTRSRQKLQ